MLHRYPEIELIRYGEWRIAKKRVQGKYLYLIQSQYQQDEDGKRHFRTQLCCKTFAHARQRLPEFMPVSDHPRKKRLVKKN